MNQPPTAGSVNVRLSAINTDLRHHARKCQQAVRRGVNPPADSVAAIRSLRAEALRLKGVQPICPTCLEPLPGLLADCERPACVALSIAAEAARKRLEDQ